LKLPLAKKGGAPIYSLLCKRRAGEDLSFSISSLRHLNTQTLSHFFLYPYLASKIGAVRLSTGT
jgi:hypothetical protein